MIDIINHLDNKILECKDCKNKLEINKNCFGKNNHRGYHPITKVRCTVNNNELKEWFWLW